MRARTCISTCTGRFEVSSGAVSANFLLAKASHMIKACIKGQKHPLPTMTPWQRCRYITQLGRNKELAPVIQSDIVSLPLFLNTIF